MSNKTLNRYTLRELLQIKNGRDHKELAEGNIPVFGSGGVMRYANKAIYDGESILLPRKGTLSNIQYVNKPFWTVDTIYYSIVNQKLANTYYLYNYIKNLDLSWLNSGTGVPSMTFDAYYDLEIYLPELATQQKIAKILSDLDVKIELNNRIYTELEAMAKTLYDYWFVQFDFPYSPPSEGCPQDGVGIGKPYKTSGGKMVWNNDLKRVIPEGWEVDKMGEISIIKAGGDKPKNLSNKQTKTHCIPIYSNGITNDGLYGYTDEAKIDSQSITISARGTIGFCVLRNKPFVPIIRLIVIIPKDSYGAKYFHETIKNIAFEKSGSVQQQLTVPQVSQIYILNPPIGLLKKFDKATSANINRIELIKEENQELASLRDWLLPMLMNGQVSVGDVAALRQAQDDMLGMVAEPAEIYKK